MIIVFNKYQGTGNDFIIIDNGTEAINPSDSALINRLCDRRFGINTIDVNSEGKTIRWSEDYAPAGTNVNFVETLGKNIFVRTYERGVEEETLSCGTGVTASAIASVIAGQIDTNPVSVMTKGGNLSVSFKINVKSITDIWLSGPATFVFEGMIKI